MTYDVTSSTSTSTGTSTGTSSAGTAGPCRSRIPRSPQPQGRSHRCTPRVLTHPHVVGRIVVCRGCGRVAELGEVAEAREVPSQRVA